MKRALFLMIGCLVGLVMIANPITKEEVPCVRRRWELDENTPIFTREPDYIPNMLTIE
jgi:hypothetical protein